VLNLAHLLKVVLWISFIVLTIDFLLAVFILRRRFGRWLYFKKRDAATKRFIPRIQSFLSGNLPTDDLVATLQSARSPAGRDARHPGFTA
jgi:hypothetical protein